MHHEHTGDCCQPTEHHHGHQHLELPLGHICTGACIHDMGDFAPLQQMAQQQATFEAVARGQSTEVAKKKDKKTKKAKRKQLGMFGLNAAGAAV